MGGAAAAAAPAAPQQTNLDAALFLECIDVSLRHTKVATTTPLAEQGLWYSAWGTPVLVLGVCSVLLCCRKRKEGEGGARGRGDSYGWGHVSFLSLSPWYLPWAARQSLVIKLTATELSHVQRLATRCRDRRHCAQIFTESFQVGGLWPPTRRCCRGNLLDAASAAATAPFSWLTKGGRSQCLHLLVRHAPSPSDFIRFSDCGRLPP